MAMVIEALPSVLAVSMDLSRRALKHENNTAKCWALAG